MSTTQKTVTQNTVAQKTRTRKNFGLCLVFTTLTASAVSVAMDPVVTPVLSDQEIKSSPAPTADENALIVHVYRSPGLDWSGPRTLAKTTIKNSLKKRAFPIGHMTVEIRCGGTSLKSGMTQRYRDEDNRVVQKEKRGLGVLLHTFAGRYEDTEKVNKNLSLLVNSGRVAVIKFLVSKESCTRMLEFEQNFVAQEMYQNYGLLSRPLEGEGGGCSAYALAYPALGGFLEPWMIEQWSRYVKVPRASVGGPLTGLRIGALKSMTSGPRRWAREHEAGFPLFFYDPDRIFDWIRNVYEGRPTSDDMDAVGAIRRIPVTRDVLGIPVTPRVTVMGLEIDRRSATPPAERNYALEQKDPEIASNNTDFLDSRWTEEKEIQKNYMLRIQDTRLLTHRYRGPENAMTEEQQQLYLESETQSDSDSLNRVKRRRRFLFF